MVYGCCSQTQQSHVHVSSAVFHLLHGNFDGLHKSFYEAIWLCICWWGDEMFEVQGFYEWLKSTTVILWFIVTDHMFRNPMFSKCGFQSTYHMICASSSSSCTDSTKFLDLVSPSIPIVHHSWQVLETASICEIGSLCRCCFVGCCFQDMLKQHILFLCSYYLAFSPSVSLESRWCIHTAVTTQPQIRRILILFY